MRPSPPDPDARRGVPKFSRDRCRGSAEFREGLAVVVEAAGLPQAVHDRPAHDALAVDHERAAHRAAAVRVEHAVRRSHRPVRPEVTQQREAELLLVRPRPQRVHRVAGDRKSTRLNSSHITISYAVFCLKKKKKKNLIIYIHKKKKKKKLNK